MAIVVLGVCTAVLLNYWFLEGVFNDNSDPTGSWISDLGARSQSTGWWFSALDALSGLALGVLTIMLWRRVAGRSRLLRWGMIALAVSALCTVLDGAGPLSCSEALPPACTSAHDLFDRLHAIESGVSIVAALAGFALLGEGFRREADLELLGIVTYVCGGAWIFFYGLVTIGFVSPTMDAVKGSFQRPAQVVFGVWVALLAAALGARHRATTRCEDARP